MIDREIDIQTKYGTMNTFITHPEADGPHPIVLFLMDAMGKREEVHDMARRLSSAGYYVILPNLYYRRVREFQIEDSTVEEMFGHMNSLTNAMVCDDIQALLDYTASDDAASEGKVGCVGYCMSGPFAFFAAAKFPDRIAASASIHGVDLYTEKVDSPHLYAGEIKGEMYFGCAEEDEFVPKNMIDDLDEHLKRTGINYSIDWYPGVKHGYVFPTRKEKYHKASAERHWERLLAMYRRCL